MPFYYSLLQSTMKNLVLKLKILNLPLGHLNPDIELDHIPCIKQERNTVENFAFLTNESIVYL